jgi:hypothetical protein
MGSRAVIAGAAVVGVCLLVSACGGGSRLSSSEYRGRLAAIGREAARAQSEVEKALSAKTVAELRARLSSFADAEQKLGDEIAAIKPPEDVEAANAKLARGERDIADAVRSVLPQLAKAKTAKAAVALITHSQAPVAGGREVDEALAQLRKLGYTKGS